MQGFAALVYEYGGGIKQIGVDVAGGCFAAAACYVVAVVKYAAGGGWVQGKADDDAVYGGYAFAFVAPFEGAVGKVDVCALG